MITSLIPGIDGFEGNTLNPTPFKSLPSPPPFSSAPPRFVKKPSDVSTIVGEEGQCVNGGLATYGLSYFNLGYKAGEMAVLSNR